MARRGIGFVCALAAAACAGPGTAIKPEAAPARPSALVELPVSLGYGDRALQRRVQRRAGDALIALAGGHAILAEELGAASDPAEIDDKQVGERVRALGEAPEQTLAFAIVASRSQRSVPNASPLAGIALGRRQVIDYVVRLEVRRAGRPEVIGSVDGVSTGEPGESEVGPRGESRGVQKAIDEALVKAVRTFAPGLMARGPGGELIAEIPAAAAATPRARQQALRELYPELSSEETRAFVHGRERFLVIRPGTLAALGLAAGDFLTLPVGQTLTSRAALARRMARGDRLQLVVERAGQRYVLASAER